MPCRCPRGPTMAVEHWGWLPGSPGPSPLASGNMINGCSRIPMVSPRPGTRIVSLWILRLEHPRYLDIATLDVSGRTVRSLVRQASHSQPTKRQSTNEAKHTRARPQESLGPARCMCYLEALHIAAQHGHADVCKVGALCLFDVISSF